MFTLLSVEHVVDASGGGYEVTGEINGAPYVAIVRYWLSYDAGGPIERPYIQNPEGLSDAEYQAIINAAESAEDEYQDFLRADDEREAALADSFSRWCEAYPR